MTYETRVSPSGTQHLVSPVSVSKMGTGRTPMLCEFHVRTEDADPPVEKRCAFCLREAHKIAATKERHDLMRDLPEGWE